MKNEKTSELWWLKEPIIKYLKNHPGSDKIDVTTHFKLRADITLNAIRELEDEGKVRSEWIPVGGIGGTTRLYVNQGATDGI